MSDIAITFDNISKQYHLGSIGTGTLSHDLNRWWAMNIRGKEDPYLKIGQLNDHASKADGDYVWALKDINFEVKHGEVLGIIGKNGAGKSTLLKILSRVTTPTTGRITAHGRIASLLEIGTGFHPEMTGRENIYMNGAIMGMTKAEITTKLDEIVDFSGVEKYIDTPVKRYSSGMTVRLGFAIAAHLEPEILVVDEVLAVGDAEFQKKAIGKMQDVSNQEGRTVLFVSHNLTSVQKLCKNGLLLSNGLIELYDDINKVIDKYINTSIIDAVVHLEPRKDLDAYVMKIEIQDENNQIVKDIPIGKKWKVVLHYQVNRSIRNFKSAVGIVNVHNLPLNTTWEESKTVSKGIYEVIFEENTINYAVGQYKFNVGLSEGNRTIQYLENIIFFNIVPVVHLIDESVTFYESTTGQILNPMNVTSRSI